MDLTVKVKASPFLQYANEVTVLQLLTVKLFVNNRLQLTLEEALNMAIRGEKLRSFVDIISIQIITATTAR